MLGAIFKMTKPGHVVVAFLFLGVPTAVPFSSFLSLIRLRLLSDPKQTNSPHLTKKKERKKPHVHHATIIKLDGRSDYMFLHLAFCLNRGNKQLRMEALHNIR